MSIAQQMIHFANLAKVKYVESIRGPKPLLEPSDEGFTSAEKILTQLNKFIGAEVVGAGHGGHGAYVFGKGGVPWGALSRINKTSPKTGETHPQWELYSRHIKKNKGQKQVTKSRSVSGIINFIRKGEVKPDTLEDMFGIGMMAAHMVKNLDIGNVRNYVAAMSGQVRHDVFWFLRDLLDEKNPDLTKEMVEWAQEVRGGYEKNQKQMLENERTKQAFRSKSIILTAMPYACDKSIHVQSMSLPAGAGPQLEEIGFISKIEELVDYPHIIGTSNLIKLESGGKDDTFNSFSDYDYIAQYNLIRFLAAGNEFVHTISLVFPAEFMDQVVQQPKQEEVMPVDNNGRIDIFSLDI